MAGSTAAETDACQISENIYFRRYDNQMSRDSQCLCARPDIDICPVLHLKHSGADNNLLYTTVAPFTNMDKLKPHHGCIITSITKCAMKLLIHFEKKRNFILSH